MPTVASDTYSVSGTLADAQNGESQVGTTISVSLGRAVSSILRNRLLCKNHLLLGARDAESDNGIAALNLFHRTEVHRALIARDKIKILSGVTLSGSKTLRSGPSDFSITKIWSVHDRPHRPVCNSHALICDRHNAQSRQNCALPCVFGTHWVE